MHLRITNDTTPIMRRRNININNNRMSEFGHNPTKIMSMLLVLSISITCCYYVDSFTTISTIPNQIRYYNDVTKSAPSSSTTSTSLNAFVAPIMIIAPMLKKMKEEAAKKRMPTAADRDEAENEAPGLRVGRAVWKWPPYWPYDDSIFQSKNQLAINERNAKLTSSASSASPVGQMNDMMSVLSGISQQTPTPPTTDNTADIVLEKDFDALQYWGVEQGTTRTNMDPDAIEKLKEHYEFYIQPGSSILEFGAAENSYLPDSIQTSRHVGIGANEKLMNENPRLTEKFVIDLNKVNPGRDIDSDVLKTLASTTEQFDYIIMANTVDYLNHPREVFRTAWYLLKPGGLMIVSFSGKDSTNTKSFIDSQTKIWSDYNNDQHLWITGSFFHFSAGDGWENLLGFDISPENAKKVDDNIIQATIKGAKNNQYFVVQATKGFQYTSIDNNAIEESISSLCWMLPVMEDRDKSLVIPRLTKIYEVCNDNSVKQAIEKNLQYLPTLYEILIKMDTFAFTFSMQSQLAAEFIANPEFDPITKPDQLIQLKQGLGLRTPSPEFWIPVGVNTGSMNFDDRINLLSYIVPKFGSSNQQQEQALDAFVNGLEPTIKLIQSKCPSMPLGDVQLVATELLACEILTINKSTPKQFAIWLDCMTKQDYESIVDGRKQLRTIATTDYEQYRQVKLQEQERIVQFKKQYDEQVNKARLERTLIFNPRTQKMQLFDNPNIQKQDSGNFITNLFQKK
jgi:SAM-dependent methyltransferase